MAAAPPASARLEALRERLKATHDQIANASDGLVARTQISKLEEHGIGANSLAVHRGIARGLGVPLDALLGYLDGTISLDEMTHLRGLRKEARDHGPQHWANLGATHPQFARAVRDLMSGGEIDDALAQRAGNELASRLDVDLEYSSWLVVLRDWRVKLDTRQLQRTAARNTTAPPRTTTRPKSPK